MNTNLNQRRHLHWRSHFTGVQDRTPSAEVREAQREEEALMSAVACRRPAQAWSAITGEPEKELRQARLFIHLLIYINNVIL